MKKHKKLDRYADSTEAKVAGKENHSDQFRDGQLQGLIKNIASRPNLNSFPSNIASPITFALHHVFSVSCGAIRRSKQVKAPSRPSV